MRAGYLALALLLGGAAPAVPAPGRIADLWFAHNELLVMLGATASIAVTVERSSTAPWRCWTASTRAAVISRWPS